MTILQIRKLALVLRLIDEGNRYEVATQSHPDTWFPPASALQWYIDANWLIRVSGIIYDPRAPQPVNDALAQGEEVSAPSAGLCPNPECGSANTYSFLNGTRGFCRDCTLDFKLNPTTP